MGQICVSVAKKKDKIWYHHERRFRYIARTIFRVRWDSRYMNPKQLPSDPKPPPGDRFSHDWAKHGGYYPDQYVLDRVLAYGQVIPYAVFGAAKEATRFYSDGIRRAAILSFLAAYQAKMQAQELQIQAAIAIGKKPKLWFNEEWEASASFPSLGYGYAWDSQANQVMRADNCRTMTAVLKYDIRRGLWTMKTAYLIFDSGVISPY